MVQHINTSCLIKFIPPGELSVALIRPAVKTLELEGCHSFFGTFLFHFICPKILVPKFVWFISLGQLASQR